MSQSDEDEPVTSTVPELTGERGEEPVIRSDRTSWLFRKSGSRSPPRDEDTRRRRVVTTRQQAPSYQPYLVSRKNEVRYLQHAPYVKSS